MEWVGMHCSFDDSRNLYLLGTNTSRNSEHRANHHYAMDVGDIKYFIRRTSQISKTWFEEGNATKHWYIRYITSHRIALHDITSHHITIHHITLYHITSHHITWLYHITSHYITLHHITSHHMTIHYIYTYIYIYVYVYIYMYIYICTYIYILHHKKKGEGWNSSGWCLLGSTHPFWKECSLSSIILQVDLLPGTTTILTSPEIW